MFDDDNFMQNEIDISIEVKWKITVENRKKLMTFVS